MAAGILKWFNPTKGYGFIQPQGGSKDVFVHIRAVERTGQSTLNGGQHVQYEEVANQGKDRGGEPQVEVNPMWGAARPSAGVWIVSSPDQKADDLEAILYDTGGLQELQFGLATATRTH